MPPTLGSEYLPIHLLDDDEENVPQQVSDVRNIIRRALERARGGQPVYHIDEDEPEDDYEKQVQEEDSEYENGFQAQQQARRPSSRNRPQRNPPLHGTHLLVPTVTAYDYQLKTNQLLELHEPLDVCPMWSGGDGDTCSPIEARFVEIKSIWVGRNNDHDIILRGLPYARTRQLHGRLECKRNEVCQIIEIEDDDGRPDEEQALVEIRPEQIMKTRILIKTNKPYPKENRPRFDPVYNTRQKIEDCAPLTCRWKMRVEYRDAAKRKAGKSYGGSLIKLGEDDVEKRRDRVPDKELRETWRGASGTKSGQPPTPYTFGDMFCGAGGVSRGALMAGLKVKIAVDHWPVACKSYRLNFPDTQLYEGEVMSFINDDSIDYRSTPIDILHLSPPCQYFSPLGYIWRGRNQNEANADALLSCFHLINKMRPRFFTLEETFGLTQPKHSQFFNALIHGFTCHGYSVQWRVVSFLEYSSPSKRNRLVILGSGPGDRLPPWVPPTHGDGHTRGRKPLVTERQAISGLRPNTDLHDVRNARPVNMPRRDGNVPFPKTICCGGTQEYQHFSGRRAYTLRELACLQGFPVVHRFEGNATAIRKQIGNAFPPCVSKVFLEHLVKHLERTDGVQPVPSRPPPPSPPSRALAASPSSGRRTGFVTQRRQRNVGPRAHHYNGDFDEDKAFLYALQQSRKSMKGARRRAAPGTRRRAQHRVIDLRDISDEDEAQDSPAGRHFAPLMERMSISSPRSSSSHAERRSSVAQASQDASEPLSRSRSATLDFSPSPPHKRSPEDMHDGAEDQTMKKESPEKRERLVKPADDNNNNNDDDAYGVVNTIPSRLPRYGGSQNVSIDDSDEYVVVGNPSGSTAAGPKHTDKQLSPCDELVLSDKTSFKEAVEKKQKPSASSGDDGGWTF